MPGCDVGHAADIEIEMPRDEPLRTLFIIACRSADRRGVKGATRYFKSLAHDFCGHDAIGWQPQAGTRASYAIGDPDVEQEVRRRVQAAVNRWGKR